MDTTRTFIVRVSESPRRVVVEDVRERRRGVAGDLADVGPQIAAWLATPADVVRADAEPVAGEDSVSAAP
jgi:hypothetical protein